MASSRLYKTYGQDADSKSKLTFSCWLKRSGLGQMDVFSAFRGSDGYQTDIVRFGSGDTLDFWAFLGPSGTSSVKTNRVFKDTSAWYHIVVSVDTSLSTASDRVKTWVNGVRETSFGTTDYPDLNSTLVPLGIGSGVEHTIGAVSTSSYFDGYLSHLHYCDGYAYTASDFGEEDSTTGNWKIKTAPSVSYGTNGFFMLKNDNSVNDQSGNSNNFTAAGTITKSEDSPSNVFATFNSLHNHYEQGSYAYGNNQYTSGGSNKYTHNNSTLGMTKGKFYAEFKWASPSSRDVLVGITDRYTTDSTHELGHRMEDKGYRYNGDLRYNNGNVSSWGASYGTGDVVMVALDLDNNCVYFGVNGTWSNSGDPTSGASKTGGQAISGVASAHDGCYYFSASVYDDNSAVWQANFGNGYFGTTAISSEGTNASGNGKFEHNVPAGYTALCTRGINSF